jgi:uncharacterized membrane protein YgcG
MEKNRRSNFNYRAWTAAAVSAAFFVPLMVFGAPALAKSAASEYEYSGSSQYQYTGKVLLCHHTHSKKHPWHQISVGAPAVKAHLKHGDYLGTCTTPPPASPATAPKHGKSGSKGKSGDHGNSGSQGNSGNQGQSGSNGNGKGHGKGK